MTNRVQIFVAAPRRKGNGLKSCRCKATGYIHQEQAGDGATYRVICQGCERSTRAYATLQAAVKAWNGGEQ